MCTAGGGQEDGDWVAYCSVHCHCLTNTRAAVFAQPCLDKVAARSSLCAGRLVFTCRALCCRLNLRAMGVCSSEAEDLCQFFDKVRASSLATQGWLFEGFGNAVLIAGQQTRSKGRHTRLAVSYSAVSAFLAIFASKPAPS
jgi:hypothetical protein